MLNADLLKLNTQDKNDNESLASLKATGIYTVRNANDMPNGNSSAVMDVMNFSSSNGNYCIQSLVYIQLPNIIYQRRIHQEYGAGDWFSFVSAESVSETKTFFGEVSAYPEYYTIYAHGTALFNNPNKTVDLHFSIVPNKVDDITIPSGIWAFISKDKISNLLGIKSVSYEPKQTKVVPTIDISVSLPTHLGKTGLLLTNTGTLSRIYDENGAVGSMSLDNVLYSAFSGKQINIDIYGATYS